MYFASERSARSPIARSRRADGADAARACGTSRRRLRVISSCGPPRRATTIAAMVLDSASPPAPVTRRCAASARVAGSRASAGASRALGPQRRPGARAVRARLGARRARRARVRRVLARAAARRRRRRQPVARARHGVARAAGGGGAGTRDDRAPPRPRRRSSASAGRSRVAAAVFLVAALVAWPVVRPTWALAALAAALVPAVAVAASGVRIAPQSGSRRARRSTVADIPRDGYRDGTRRPARRPAPAARRRAGQRRAAAPRHGHRRARSWRCRATAASTSTSATTRARPGALTARGCSRRSYDKRGATFYGDEPSDVPGTGGARAATRARRRCKIDYTAVVGDA